MEVGHGGGGGGDAEFWQPADVKERVSAQDLAKSKPLVPSCYIPKSICRGDLKHQPPLQMDL